MTETHSSAMIHPHLAGQFTGCFTLFHAVEICVQANRIATPIIGGKVSPLPCMDVDGEGARAIVGSGGVSGCELGPDQPAFWKPVKKERLKTAKCFCVDMFKIKTHF